MAPAYARLPSIRIPLSPRSGLVQLRRQRPTQRRLELGRRDTPPFHALHANMPGKRVERAREPRERRVAIRHAPARARRGLARREPGLEVRVARLEQSRLAVRLEVDASEQLAVVE